MTMVPNSQDFKRDAGKPQMSFLLEFYNALVAFVRVCEYGAKKYGRGTWPRVEKQRYLDAELRHALSQGPDTKRIDAESGLPNKWHDLWNLMVDIELEEREKENQKCQK